MERGWQRVFAVLCVLHVSSLGACVATHVRARTWPLLPGGKAGGCSPSEEKAAEEPNHSLSQTTAWAVGV